VEAWTVAGRYRVTGEIDRGGTGIVYDAVHVLTGRAVALKHLHPRLRTDPAVAHRFAREARTDEKLRHPHLVDVLDMGVDDAGAPFFVMERLDGFTLGSRLGPGGRLAPTEACAVLIPIGRAVEFLHRHAIVHRDIKPGSVFLAVDAAGRLVPKLLDLGIVGQVGRDDRLQAGAARYMAPECAIGTASGPAADLWSLAAVFFECLSGTTAHGLSPAERAKALGSVPREVAAPILCALANDPRARPESVSAFLDRIERAVPRWHETALHVASGGKTGAAFAFPEPRTAPGRSRAPWAVAALAAAVALVPAALWIVAAGPTSLLATSKHEAPKLAIVPPVTPEPDRRTIAVDSRTTIAEPLLPVGGPAHRTTSARVRSLQPAQPVERRVSGPPIVRE
jgi:serine/threonine-protein kinase